MKRMFFMMATMLMATTVAQAQQTETVELPLSLYNQTKWQAKETTVALNGEEEELPAYELQGWDTYQGMSRHGTVYYVPSALNDRIILVMKDVDSGYSRLPFLIDNKTNKSLIIHVRGRVSLSSQSTVIRSVGDVSIYGQETEDDAEPTSTFILQCGLRGKAALSTDGDVYLQNIRLEVGNSAPYGFLCTYTGGKEERIFEMNHVTGNATGEKAAVAGFQKIVGSQGTSVKGIEPNWSLEDEYRGAGQEEKQNSADDKGSAPAKPAERVVGGDLFTPFSVMGQSRFAQNPMEEITFGNGMVKKGISLSVELREGTIYWIPEDESLLFHNVDLVSETTMPVIESSNALTIYFSGNNQISSVGDGIVSRGHLMLIGIQPKYTTNTLKVETTGDCIKLTDSHNLYAENLSMRLSGKQGVVSEGSGDTEFRLRTCELDIKGQTSGIQGFFDIIGINCGPLYGYWQAPKTLLYDQKARTFMLGSEIFKELQFESGAYLVINTKEAPWVSSKAEKVLQRD